MKKMLIWLLVFSCAALAGCRSSQPAIGETTETTVSGVPAVSGFLDIEWTRITCECTETLYFRSNGDCSYTCACGNPVNDDDLCEGYRYDENTQTIYLNFSETTEETVTQITVKSCDGNTLVLDFNGESRAFQRAEET